MIDTVRIVFPRQRHCCPETIKKDRNFQAILTFWLAIDPFGELDVRLVSSDGLGSLLRLQGFTHQTSGNVGVVDVAGNNTIMVRLLIPDVPEPAEAGNLP